MFLTSGGHSDLETKILSLITAAGQCRIFTVRLRRGAGILSPLPLMAEPHQNLGFAVIYHAQYINANKNCCI